MKQLIYILMLGCALASASPSTSPPIVANIDAVPVTLIPSKITDTIGAWVLLLISDRLLESQRSGMVTGNLAANWSVSQNGTRYSFKLRDNAVFTDGTKLTSADVVRSFDALKKNVSKGYLSFYIKNVEKVSAPNASEVVIDLKKPVPGFLNLLGESAFSIYKMCGEEPCFTGRFRVKKQASDAISLERSSDGQVFELRKMTFDQAEKAFKKGDVQILRTFGLPHIPRARHLAKTFYVMNDERAYFVALNTQSPVCSQNRVREFVAQQIRNSSSAIGEVIAKWEGTESDSLLSPSFLMGRIDLEEVPPTTAPGKLKSIKPLEVVLLKEQELGQLAEAVFAKVPHVFRYLDKKDFIERIKSGNYDAMFFGYGTTVRDLNSLSILFHSQSMHNFARVRDPEIDQLLEEAWTQASAEKKMMTIKRVLSRNSTQHWYVHITHSPLIFAISDKLETATSSTGDHIMTSSNLDLGGMHWKK